MKFDLKTLEGQIAYAIYTECSERYFNLDEFCESYSFTKEDFFDFLQYGINTMAAIRVLQEYNEE